jgi:AraC family transcriptional regulator
MARQVVREEPMARPLRVLSRRSSTDLGWSGFEAILVEVDGGYSKPLVVRRHNICMLAGPPLHTTARCDDLFHDRFEAPGEFDVVPAGSSIAWNDGGHSLFFTVALSQEMIAATAAEMGLDAELISFAPQLTCRDEQMERMLWSLKAELEAEEPLGRIFAESLGTAVAAHLLRRYAPVVPRRVTGGLPRRRLQRVLSYIHEQLDGDLSLLDIAEVAGVSSSHFKVLFRQSVGVPVHRYVMRKRVERATELIVGTSQPLSDVAQQAGFANQSHMARCLRRAIGVTPKALRDAV